MPLEGSPISGSTAQLGVLLACKLLHLLSTSPSQLFPLVSMNAMLRAHMEIFNELAVA